MLVAGRSNKEIGSALGIEERTVKAHVAKLMRKVGVQNRIALSVHAITHSLVTAKGNTANVTNGQASSSNLVPKSSSTDTAFTYHRTWETGLGVEIRVATFSPDFFVSAILPSNIR